MATSVVSWTVQPGANFPSAVPISAGESPPSVLPVTGLPGSLTSTTGLAALSLSPFWSLSPLSGSAEPPPAATSSALPSPPVPSVTGVKEVYAVSARSEVLGWGQSRLVRCTGSWAAAFAVVSPPEASGALNAAKPVTAARAVVPADQGQGRAVHCWLPSGRSLSAPVPCDGSYVAS